jgi:hypothetical protein
MNEVTQAVDDRIDYLKAKYSKTNGAERMEWKARLNEANLIREAILLAMNKQKGNNDA